MRYAITPEDMREREKTAFAHGVPSLLLMEAAAAQVDAVIGRVQSVVCVCGAGNNGGDGLAIARRLHLRGVHTRVYLADGTLTIDASIQLQYLRALGIEPQPLDRLPAEMPPADVCVDALFGIGLSRPLTSETLAAVRAINALNARRVCVDVPSGLSGLTGEPLPECVQANETVTFHMEKLGLLNTCSRGAAGKVTVVPIGLPDDSPTPFTIIEPGDDTMPPLPRDAHKGSRGRALIIAGSRDMTGAAALCANAALRAGIGLAYACCEDDAAAAILSQAPCAVRKRREEIGSAPCDVVAVGPGLGQEPGARDALMRALARGLPTVADADALNILASSPVPLGAHVVITPHPGEAARLLHTSVHDVERNRLAAARALCRQYACHCVLKGSVSIISHADGVQAAFCAFGTPGLAKAGSGDTLTGIMTAMLYAFPGDPFRAARAACARHAEAALRAAQAHGEHGMLATDVLSAIRVGA